MSKHVSDRVLAKRYKTRSVALYQIYRHALVHHGEPGRIRVGTREINWAIYRRFGRLKVHLRLLTQVWNRTYKLEIDADLLHDHVLAAFRDVRDRAAQEADLAREIHLGAVKASEPQEFALANPKTRRTGAALAHMLMTPVSR